MIIAITIVERPNAKGEMKFWIEGRPAKSYGTLLAARNAAREIGKWEQLKVAAPHIYYRLNTPNRWENQARLARSFPPVFDKDLGAIAQARRAGVPVPGVEIVEAL